MDKDVMFELEKERVLNSVKQGKRLDGRAFDAYREIELREKISENAHGSAWSKVGESEVIAGVKMELGEPYPDSQDEGAISVGLELMPLASPSFETGPLKVEAVELARVVDRGIRESHAIDPKKLCIKEGELVWIVFIDLYVANDDGNLFDAAQFAAMKALSNAKIPKVEDDKIVKGEFSGDLPLTCKPILNTFANIGGKVALDPTLIEEKAMSARLSVATLDDGRISAFQKGLAGSFSKEQVSECIETALKRSKEIRKSL